MKRRTVLTSLAAAAAAAALSLPAVAKEALPQVQVFKNPYQVLLVAKDGRERVFSSYN